MMLNTSFFQQGLVIPPHNNIVFDNYADESFTFQCTYRDALGGGLGNIFLNPTYI